MATRVLTALFFLVYGINVFFPSLAAMHVLAFVALFLAVAVIFGL